ncbi:hypothetical protein CAPTEDRAFT_193809 [Capitella teleta]|uniref:F-box domain-containing protein n=1 Tax=Capitella teleta TaxID=283909 RepID=R7T6H7_CAPTE|nr:hypothetical protein CAPTEDRAFT_193809 [Capitella teleta]|eukprot:ELT89090.1 hypothetical protein CAPTEDRAFT_193809 [Capitella teleta]
MMSFRDVSLLDLPCEILLHILDLVDTDSRQCVRHVCKALRDMVDDPLLWRHRCLHLLSEAQRKSPRHLLRVLRRRNPSNVSLDHCHNVSLKKLDLLFGELRKLRRLRCSCCVAQYLATKENVRLSIDALRINSELCKGKARGGCIADLSLFEHLKSLHVDATLSFEESVSAVIEHVSKLHQLRELALRICKVPPDPRWSHSSITSLSLQSFPHLKVLKLHGIPVNSELFYASQNVALDKLDIGQISEMDEWIESIHSVTNLRLQLKPPEVNSTLRLLREHLSSLQELSIQADGLGIYPVEFELLPLSLKTFSLHWTVGGMVRKEKGILGLIPAELREKLEGLHLPQIRLTEHDIVTLADDFANLQHLSCSLADSVSSDTLGCIANHKRLRKVSLWFSLEGKFHEAAKKIEEKTECRLLVRFDTNMSRLNQMYDGF